MTPPHSSSLQIPTLILLKSPRSILLLASLPQLWLWLRNALLSKIYYKLHYIWAGSHINGLYCDRNTKQNYLDFLIIITTVTIRTWFTQATRWLKCVKTRNYQQANVQADLLEMRTENCVRQLCKIRQAFHCSWVLSFVNLKTKDMQWIDFKTEYYNISFIASRKKMVKWKLLNKILLFFIWKKVT